MLRQDGTQTNCGRGTGTALPRRPSAGCHCCGLFPDIRGTVTLMTLVLLFFFFFNCLVLFSLNKYRNFLTLVPIVIAVSEHKMFLIRKKIL